MKKFVLALTVVAIASSAAFVATQANAIPPFCNPQVKDCG